MTPFLKPLPRYACRKEVGALKIQHVIPNPRGVELHFEDTTFVPFQLGLTWAATNDPKPGWFLVVHDDGYISCSPPHVFEEDYVRIADVVWPALEGVGPTPIDDAGAVFQPHADAQEQLTVRLDLDAPCRNALARGGKSYPKSNCQRCGTLLRPGWQCAEGIKP